METIRRVSSPDDELELIVVRTGDVLAIGFEGCAWHLHPEAIADVYYWGQSIPADAVLERFLTDVLADRLWIGVRRDGGKIVDAWICDDETRELDVRDPDVELRRWSGSSRR
jgi:hypothetical protein